MNKELEGRLYNYKFEQALRYLEGEDDNTKLVVKSLSNMFGSPGWFDGDMAVIVTSALESIGVNMSDEESDEI